MVPTSTANESIALPRILQVGYKPGMDHLSKLFGAAFTTRTLGSIACFLAGLLLMKGLGDYYGFNWISALAAQ
jgi:hypothetical protein